MRLYAIALALMLLAPVPTRARMILTNFDEKGRYGSFILDGEITRDDVVMFQKTVQFIRPKVQVLNIQPNSPGGDVLAAMEIGEIVRREWLMTTVDDADPSTQCSSACVLIFAAGAVRIVGSASRIGIHRPHFDSRLFAGLEREQAKAKYDELSRSVASYLSKMGMSDELFRAMMDVPSNQIRMLTFTEMSKFNLRGSDPGYEEWHRAKNVTRYGEQLWGQFEAWTERRQAFVDRCISTKPKLESTYGSCGEEFDRRDPDPLNGH